MDEGPRGGSSEESMNDCSLYAMLHRLQPRVYLSHTSIPASILNPACFALDIELSPLSAIATADLTSVVASSGFPCLTSGARAISGEPR